MINQDIDEDLEGGSGSKVYHSRQQLGKQRASENNSSMADEYSQMTKTHQDSRSSHLPKPLFTKSQTVRDGRRSAKMRG